MWPGGRGQDLLAQAVDQVEVGAHALAHDFGRDVDHVRVAHVAAVDDVGHLHARAELIGLHLHGKDGDLRGFHVGQHGGGHVGERARGEVFEEEGVPRAADGGELGGEGGGDGRGDAIGDQRDFFLGLDAQAGGDGGAGSLGELGGVRGGKQLRGGLVHVQITSSVQGEGTGF